MKREDALKIVEWYRSFNDTLVNSCNIHAAATNYLLDNADSEQIALITPHAAELRNTVQVLETLLMRSQRVLAFRSASEHLPSN